jgi:hydrophobic/amphiphilic exporter-1 (mainly G- bacteria), HAE1 family
MTLTRIAINNPVFCAMVMLAACVMGWVSYTKLPIDAMPETNLPFAVVFVSYPGASPEAVENDLTKSIENALNPVAGVKTLRSRSREGSSLVIIEFALGTDINRGIQDLRDKLSVIRPGFPKDAKDPYISKARDDNEQPIVSVGLTGATNLRELTRIVEDVVVRRIENVSGVGTVSVSGQARREIAIKLDAEKMKSFGVGIDQVTTAMRADNFDSPVGAISRGAEERLLRVEARLARPEQFGDIVVARRGGANILLKQIATINDAVAERNSYARINGKEAIGVDILKVNGANTVEVGEATKKALEDVKKALPANVEMTILSDQSKYVKRNVDGVKKTIIEGALLTVLIVFLFLKSWRSTIITGLTLPIAVISTFIALNALGFTLNGLTLLALSLCIGLLIDDAIVVRENIVRHVHLGKDHMTAARDGTDEIGLAVLATTFAIVAVFAPIGFMGGIIGLFFHQFGITVVVAVLVSLFVSFTLDPMLSAVWEDKPSKWMRWPGIRHFMDGFEHVVEWLHRVYDSVLGWALNHRWTTLGIALGSLVGCFALVPYIGSEFQPKSDRSEFSVRIETPVGSSLDYTRTKIEQVEALLKKYPEVEYLYSRVGSNNGKNTGFVNVTLTPTDKRKRTQFDIEDASRKEIEQVGGLRASIGWGKPINVTVLGPDAAQLKLIAADLTKKIASVKGAVDVDSSDKAAVPAYAIRPNRVAANDLGISVPQISQAARVLVGGDVVGTWLSPAGDNIDVRVRLDESDRADITALGDVPVSAGVNPDGTPRVISLKQVATVESTTSPKVIERLSLQRQITVSAGVSGRTEGEVNDDVQALTKATNLPPGFRFVYEGQAQIMQESFGYAVLALGLSVIFIYFVLGAQFNSFTQPIVIMLSLPLSLIGVFVALLFTGSTLNILSIIGIIMLMGLVTKNAILLVDFANQARREGASIVEALQQAGQIRLRPILMTTAAMVFGMLPMALAREEGADGSMGRAIIGGVLTSTLLTLVVVPVGYALLEGFKERWKARRQAKKDRAALAEQQLKSRITPIDPAPQGLINK